MRVPVVPVGGDRVAEEDDVHPLRTPSRATARS
jgi:hypothetical protein